MTRSVSTAVLGIVASLALLALGGCAPVPPDAWRLEPIRYDNRSEGVDGPARFIDVTFPMRLTPDTAGGFWGESARSWLHLDADGTALRRFNLGLDAPFPIYGMSALTPSRLLVSAPADGASGAIHLFDTATGSWETVYREIGILGDLAVRGDDVYIVEFAAQQDQSGMFTVRRLDLRAPDVLVDASPPFPVPAGSSWLYDAVALDVGPDGTLFLATHEERIVVGADGEVLERTAHETPYPLVAVGPDGTAVWSGGRASADDVPFHVTRGSAEARDVLAVDCSGDALEVAAGVSGLTLPFLCAPRGIAWLSADTFVVSVGFESGAVLARVDAPVE